MSCTDPGVLEAVAGLKDRHGVNASQGALPAAAAETNSKDVHCGGTAPAEADGGGEADGGDGVVDTLNILKLADMDEPSPLAGEIVPPPQADGATKPVNKDGKAAAHE
eukprot:139037-Pleurochrysis_carterae.AAC.1